MVYLGNCHIQTPPSCHMRACSCRAAASTIFLMVLGSLFASEAAFAGLTKFDPSLCKEDTHGHSYVALGRNVVAAPGFVIMQTLPPASSAAA
jgi:hypothetical protein